MSQDFEFTEQDPPREPLTPAQPTPPPAPATRPPSPGKPVDPRPDPLYRSPLSVGAGLLILLALAGGIGYLGVDSYKNAAASEAPTPPASGDEAKPPAASNETPTATPAAAPNPDLAAEVEGLKASLKSATDRLDELAARPASDARPLVGRLEAIEKAQKALAGVPDKLASLDEKVSAARPEPAGEAMAKIDAVDKRVGEIAQAVDAVKAEVAAMARPATAPAASADTPKPEDVNMADQALSQGADLFKQRKYAEALDVFTKLQADHPEDARVWYFSALANGLATRNWAGETVQFVNKGVEREKAGSPEASKIDAVFSDLTTANGKDWLAAYRARAASR